MTQHEQIEAVVQLLVTRPDRSSDELLAFADALDELAHYQGLSPAFINQATDTCAWAKAVREAVAARRISP